MAYEFKIISLAFITIVFVNFSFDDKKIEVLSLQKKFDTTSKFLVKYGESCKKLISLSMQEHLQESGIDTISKSV